MSKVQVTRYQAPKSSRKKAMSPGERQRIERKSLDAFTKDFDNQINTERDNRKREVTHFDSPQKARLNQIEEQTIKQIKIGTHNYYN